MHVRRSRSAGVPARPTSKDLDASRRFPTLTVDDDPLRQPTNQPDLTTGRVSNPRRRIHHLDLNGRRHVTLGITCGEALTFDPDRRILDISKPHVCRATPRTPGNVNEHE